MTLEQLSASTVKIQLSETEVSVFLQDAQNYDPNSPQMLRLMSFLLAKAELFCEIPFSKGQVSVEMLNADDGGMIVYFSAVAEKQNAPFTQCKTTSLTGMFGSYTDLVDYCRQILHRKIKLSGSILYQIGSDYLLLMQFRGKQDDAALHLLLEFGNSVDTTPLLRARLAEYGVCLIDKNAVRRIAATQT